MGYDVEYVWDKIIINGEEQPMDNVILTNKPIEKFKKKLNYLFEMLIPTSVAYKLIINSSMTGSKITKTLNEFIESLPEELFTIEYEVIKFFEKYGGSLSKGFIIKKHIQRPNNNFFSEFLVDEFKDLYYKSLSNCV